MSLADSVKGPKGLIIIFGGAVIVIAALIIFLLPPKGKKADEGSEVISRRVKIEIKDEPAPPPEVKTAAVPPAKTPADTKKAPEPLKAAIPANKEYTSVAAKPEPLKKETIAAQPKKEGPRITASKKQKPEKATTQAKKAAASKKTAKASSSRQAASKEWALNIASFPSSTDAQGLTSALRSRGYNAYVTEFKNGKAKWYRVRVGFYRSREEARRVGRAIASRIKLHQEPWIMKPPKTEVAEHIK